MYKDILKAIESVEIFPIISLLIFFIFFLVMIYGVIRYDKSLIKKMSKLPLEDDEIKGNRIVESKF